jgi:hypothetical protein
MRVIYLNLTVIWQNDVADKSPKEYLQTDFFMNSQFNSNFNKSIGTICSYRFGLSNIIHIDSTNNNISNLRFFNDNCPKLLNKRQDIYAE